MVLRAVATTYASSATMNDASDVSPSTQALVAFTFNSCMIFSLLFLNLDLGLSLMPPVYPRGGERKLGLAQS